ncbi:Atu4866 domain-containing protein [Ancylobacter sp. IITR112]|uniref:Atu4866 domain-containing protein n=1 Tax=Ancylobacter sp. IITR112 TaxID=3138073 RepID=UPI00352B89F4
MTRPILPPLLAACAAGSLLAPPTGANPAMSTQSTTTQSISTPGMPAQTAHAPGAAGDAARTGPDTDHPYVGLWVTADRYVRHELLPNGRYDEARGARQSAYRGRYEVRGTQIDYWDDTGFTADGVFVDADTLHHGGMVLRRVK